MNLYIFQLQNDIIKKEVWKNVKIKDNKIFENYEYGSFCIKENLNKYINYPKEDNYIKTMYISFRDDCDFDLLCDAQLYLLYLKQGQINKINERIDILNKRKNYFKLKKKKQKNTNKIFIE